MINNLLIIEFAISLVWTFCEISVLKIFFVDYSC